MNATIQRSWNHAKGGPELQIEHDAPEARYTAPVKTKRTEAELQREVIAWIDGLLRLTAFVFHVPNGGKRDRRTAAILRGLGVRKGVADLGILLEEGHTGWIELKTETGRQEPEQRLFADVCARLGHRYCICRSVTEVHATLLDWGVTFIEPPLARAHREGR